MDHESISSLTRPRSRDNEVAAKLSYEQRPIGVFDSGLGGLTVLNELLALLPAEDFVYLGDTARVPYGIRSQKTIVRYSQEASEFLRKKSVKAIIIACNTATACAGQALWQKFAPLPVFGVIEAGVKAISQLLPSEREIIAIAATRATILSGEYQQKLTKLCPDSQLMTHPCPLFVPLVEEGWLDNSITRQIIHHYLDQLHGAQCLLLACTHFPLLKQTIQEEFPHFKIVDSAIETARHVTKALADQQKLKKSDKTTGNLTIYLTDVPAEQNLDLSPFPLQRKIASIQHVKITHD